MAGVAILAGAAIVHAGSHPSLLISPRDLPRLRHLYGVAPAVEAAEMSAWGRHGRFAEDYQALRAYFGQHVPIEPLPGEVLAAALVHLIEPDDPADASRLRFIEAALRGPHLLTIDDFELVVALDWCWRDLAPSARRDFMLRLREKAELLTPTDSPLRHEEFRAKLAALALAVAIDELDDPNPSWQALRTRLLEAGRTYVAETLPTFVKWRGISPTGPGVAADEISDTALLIELGAPLLGRDVWPDYRDSVGRWLEPYVMARMEHPALAHGFLHDDGDAAPQSPADPCKEMHPVAAHLIAVRTEDRAAVRVAHEVERELRHSKDLLPMLWRWVPAVLDIGDLEAADPVRVPTARNMDGAVVFRGGRGPQAVAIWIDAGQPFLRRRQHFDAGHFLIQRGGHLTVDGGDDVRFQAIASSGGEQRLGRSDEPFDFEQYATSSIAHNCLVCWDAARITHWYGQRYLPMGGQRAVEQTCTDFETPLRAQDRLTGQQLAYGYDDAHAYLALDLAPAYEPRAIEAYKREFVFLWGRALIVIDRVRLSSSRSSPTWIVNIPARPTIDEQELLPEHRVAGSSNDGGVWRYDHGDWLHWTDRDGALWMTPLMPQERILRVVGGPAEILRVKDGPHQGRPYVGGAPDGFERLIVPAERHGAQNAWYRLGSPPLLGAQFGHMPHWGRIEIEPQQRAETHVFVSVFVTDRADGDIVPEAALARSADGYVLRVSAGDERAELQLPTGLEHGGSVKIAGSPAWKLPTEVTPDGPMK